jgi:hypothetical protein
MAYDDLGARIANLIGQLDHVFESGLGIFAARGVYNHPAVIRESRSMHCVVTIDTCCAYPLNQR